MGNEGWNFHAIVVEILISKGDIWAGNTSKEKVTTLRKCK